MIYSVTMKRVLEEKIKRLTRHSPQGSSAKIFWKDLSNALKILAKNPVERGEILYTRKHVGLVEYASAFGPIGIQFAVNEENGAVFITRLSISGNHPYPQAFEELLNAELT